MPPASPNPHDAPTPASWFLARTAADRPALSHAVELPHDPRTLCGVATDGWSRFFIERPLEVFSCKNCLRISGATAQSRLVSSRVRRFGIAR
jgi:hypothetical protein